MSNQLATLDCGGGVFSFGSVAGLNLQLRAGVNCWQDALCTIPAVADGDPIAAWWDARKLTLGDAFPSAVFDGTNGHRPALKLAVQNGKAVVRFTAANSQSLTVTFSGTLAQPNTIFLAGSMSTNGTFFYDGIDGTHRHAQGDGLAGGDNNNQGLFAGSVIEAAQAVPTGFNLWTALFNGASSSLRRNAAAFASGDAGAQSLTGLTLGNRYALSFYLAGDIGDLVLYNSNVSAADRGSVENAINGYYTIY